MEAAQWLIYLPRLRMLQTQRRFRKLESSKRGRNAAFPLASLLSAICAESRMQLLDE